MLRRDCLPALLAPLFNPLSFFLYQSIPHSSGTNINALINEDINYDIYDIRGRLIANDIIKGFNQNETITVSLRFLNLLKGNICCYEYQINCDLIKNIID